MKKIRVRDIKPGGSVFKDIIDPGVVGTRDDDSLHFTSPISVQAKVEHLGKEILADIHLRGEMVSFCYRCLEPVEKTFDEKLVLNFPVNRTLEFIDLEEELRQEIILDFPNKILCQPECKGLCPQCGKNLNKEDCSCNKNLNNKEYKCKNS